MKPITAGQLRHKVTLQKLGTRVDDGMGGGPIPFEDVVEVYASIEPLSGREQLLAGQIEAELSHRIRTRFVAGVKPHWRIKYIDPVGVDSSRLLLESGYHILLESGDFLLTESDDPTLGLRLFDIESIADPESRHRELELMCNERLDW